ncbi:MAG: MarR family transcriptional regulator [Pyrinomonadaceae bacterium]
MEIEEILNGFTEVMSRLMIDQYQQHIAELDLTLPQAQALRILRRGPVTTGQLGAELRTSAPAITQLTDRLIRKELIERRAAADDRRCVIVALSSKGRRLVDQFRKRRSEIFTGALAQLSEDERVRAVEALEKVLRALENYESSRSVAAFEDCGATGKRQKEQSEKTRGY